ncbi:BH3 interacting domain death agonist isoform 1-T1 [Menidia menidia]
MDESIYLSSRQKTEFVILAFLQADLGLLDYNNELLALSKDFPRDINANGPRTETLLDGDLECDGNPRSSINFEGDDVDAAALREVAEGLRDIAARIEHNLVARATENLKRKLRDFPPEQWTHHLADEVDRLMKGGVGLDFLPQERVMVALTLTLVRGVCRLAPRLLRGLCDSALRLVCRQGAR